MEKLESVVRDEQSAILRLDAAAVARAAEAKQALLAELCDESPLTLAAAARLGALREGLRNNLVLLTHARDLVRDALTAARADIPVGAADQGYAPSLAPRLRITV